MTIQTPKIPLVPAGSGGDCIGCYHSKDNPTVGRKPTEHERPEVALAGNFQNPLCGQVNRDTGICEKRGGQWIGDPCRWWGPLKEG